MGALLDAAGCIINLPSRLLVGREGTAGLRLADTSVSGEHAVLAHRGGEWALRDLGSLNGTFLNAVRLEPGVGRAIHEGDEVRFGGTPVYRVIDVSATKPFARRLSDGLELAASSDVLGLPSCACPTLQIMPMGAGWVCSGEAGDFPAEDGQVVVVNGQRWRLFLPCGAEETRRPSDLVRVQQLTLTFKVSADEETVLIEARAPRWVKVLESRAHNYLLLHLARHRLQDQRRPWSEQGWIDRATLARRLHLDSEHINVQLFRIRRTFADAGVADAGNLLECRRRPGQVRIGLCELKVEPLDAGLTPQSTAVAPSLRGP